MIDKIRNLTIDCDYVDISKLVLQYGFTGDDFCKGENETIEIYSCFGLVESTQFSDCPTAFVHVLRRFDTVPDVPEYTVSIAIHRHQKKDYISCQFLDEILQFLQVTTPF